MDKIEDKEMQNIVEGIIEKRLTALDRTTTISQLSSATEVFISYNKTGAYGVLLSVCPKEYFDTG